MADDKLERLTKKLSDIFDKWIEDFETSPLSTTLKALAILYAIKWARRNLL